MCLDRNIIIAFNITSLSQLMANGRFLFAHENTDESLCSKVIASSFIFFNSHPVIISKIKENGPNKALAYDKEDQNMSGTGY